MSTKLEDLFVSYKSLSPSNLPVKKTDETKSYPQFIGTTRRTRAQRILSPKSEDDSSVVSSEEEIDDILEEEQDQPDDVQWFTSQLWAAWRDNTAPSDYQSASSARSRGLYGPVTPYNRGRLQTEIEELFAEAGISIRATSGKRPAGQAGNAGNSSHHVGGNAVDIVPTGQETFDTLRTKMLRNPEILQFFYENGLGVIDETTPAAMQQYGSTGAHFHIGPDNAATRTWNDWLEASAKASYLPVSERTGNEKKDWTKMMYNAYYKKLSEEWGDQYDNEQYQKIAKYLTYLSALESGWGQHANGFNYGGHTKNGQVLNYNTLDEFLDHQMSTLSKWDYMSSDTLRDFIDSLYIGQYRYNADLTPDEYYSRVSGVSKTADSYLGFHKTGGKFALLRQHYEKGFN